MTHYLAITTAWAAVAVLVWLATLLSPQLLPPASPPPLRRPWVQAGLFALALGGVAALHWLDAQGRLLAGGEVLAASASQLLLFLPVLAFLLYRRTITAVLLPSRGLLRSLAVGLVLAVAAAAIYLSARGGTLSTTGMLSANTAELVLRMVLIDITLGCALALLTAGRSRRTALGVILVLVTAFHAYNAWQGGGAMEDWGAMALGTLVTTALLAAIVETRNIAWLIPVQVLLALLAQGAVA